VPSLAIATFTAINNLSTTPQQIMLPNPSRKRILFHSPGGIDIYVAPLVILVNGQSVSLNPSLGSLGGCYHIFYGGDRVVTDWEAQQGWQAFSQSSTAQPLTIVEGFS
jgi:hypothetical protein